MTDSAQAPVYQIRIKGHLSRRWESWFGGLVVILADDGDTLLTGQIADQAALHGLLRKVRDVGMPLISVTRIYPDQTPWPTRSGEEDAD